MGHSACKMFKDVIFFLKYKSRNLLYVLKYLYFFGKKKIIQFGNFTSPNISMSSFFEIDFKKTQNYIEFQKEKNKHTMFNLKTKNNHEIKMQNS